jgi:hypothetical protein
MPRPTSFAVVTATALATLATLAGPAASAQEAYGAYPQDGAQPVQSQDAYGTYPADPGQGVEMPVARVAPPPLPDYDQPPLVAEGYIWQPGYWAYGAYGYYWVPGAWIAPPQPGLLWTPGYWAWNGGGYAFSPGYWGLHVGYYGGIAYGFGYGGVGYEGGYWSGGRFLYNRAANNFGGTYVRNVYVRNVTYVGSAHVSFNGPGGASYRPSATELAYSREVHVAPTAQQLGLVRAAATNRSAFATVNHGRPAIAAVARPRAMPAAAQPVQGFHQAVPVSAQGVPHGQAPAFQGYHAAEPGAPAPAPSYAPERPAFQGYRAPEPRQGYEPRAVAPSPSPAIEARPAQEFRQEPIRVETRPQPEFRAAPQPMRAEPRPEPRQEQERGRPGQH